jgi:hypothetical protein
MFFDAGNLKSLLDKSGPVAYIYASLLRGENEDVDQKEAPFV